MVARDYLPTEIKKSSFSVHVAKTILQNYILDSDLKKTIHAAMWVEMHLHQINTQYSPLAHVVYVNGNDAKQRLKRKIF